MGGGPNEPQLVRRVPVNRFSRCGCTNNLYGRDHLLVQTREVSLEPGEAIAVSYGIGDYDRQLHVFGHRDGEEDVPIRLQFGGEWTIHDLKSSLVNLSKQQGIWLDQLSIPQDLVQIPTHLQSVAEIYRTFEVFVLWPNAPCPCLAECVESYKAGDQRFTDQHGDIQLMRIIEGCFNSFPTSSYFSRLWTKQEFVYARKISLYCCGPPAGPCSRGTYDWGPRTLKLSPSQTEHLGKWARWRYEQCVREVTEQGDWAAEAAWSLFREIYSACFNTVIEQV